MRFTQRDQLSHLGHVTLSQPVAHPLALVGEQGERLQLSVLDEDLIHVQYWPGGRPRLDRTWLVVGKDGTTPREGRRRDDLSPFPLPGFAWTADERALHLRTRQLQATVHLDDARIEWRDANGELFAADLPGRGYAHDRAGQAVAHCLERRAGEHYYGLGERAGELDRAGQRIRMVDVDAFGYDARTTDPLYKHFPFYIT